MVIKDLWKYYGDELVFAEFSATIDAADRIGLVGANGVGKTTLLRVLAGELDAEQGSISFGKNYTIGILTQHLTEADETLEEYLTAPFQPILEMASELRALESRLSDPEVYSNETLLNQTMESYGQLEQRFSAAGGYDYRVQIRTAAIGLGFSEADLSRPLPTFSGGEKMRAGLAQLLLSKPDLLLLDEPTNHLDVEAIEWLESYLAAYPKALVVVSHDRYFLDRVCTRIWEMQDQRVFQYKGNYSTYLPQREQLRKNLRQEAEKLAEERERITNFIRKFGAGTRARQAKSLEKKLQRMDDVQVLSDDPSLRFRIKPRRQSGTRVVELSGITKAYDDTIILEEVSAEVRRGDRIALIGPNGSGKSTLLKILAGELDFQGKLRWGTNVDVGYFSQEIVFNPANTVLEELYDEHRMELGVLRSVLAQFLFRGDDVFKPTTVLSGGERNRLALAKLLLAGPNFLLLDEPTNHLDIYAREALETSLQDFGGTLIFVSHDRYFIDKLADKLWIMQNGTIAEFVGNFSEYRVWQKEMAAAQKEAQIRKENRAREEAQKAKGSGLSKWALEKKQQELEDEIILLEEQKAELEHALASPDLYLDDELSKRTVEEYNAVRDKLSQYYKDWETLVERLQEG